LADTNLLITVTNLVVVLYRLFHYF